MRAMAIENTASARIAQLYSLSHNSALRGWGRGRRRASARGRRFGGNGQPAPARDAPLGRRPALRNGPAGLVGSARPEHRQ